MELLDLSQSIEEGMPRFPSLPSPTIRPFWSHEESARSGRYQGCTCEVSQIQMVTSLGTYLDSPFHFDPEGLDIGRLPLDSLVLSGKCLDLRGKGAGEGIGAQDLGATLGKGEALLLCTGWSRHWGTESYQAHPFLTREAVSRLLGERVGLVGIDALVLDDVRDPTRPAHSLLLPKGVLILENLTNLEALIGRVFTLFAVPPKVKGVASFPVRAFALLT